MKFLATLLLSISSTTTLISAAVIRPANSPAEGSGGYSNGPIFENAYPDAAVVPGSYIITLKPKAKADSHLDHLASVIGKPRASVIHGDNDEDCDLSVAASTNNKGQRVQAQFKGSDKYSYVAILDDNTVGKLMDDGDIERIEPNYIQYASATKAQYGAPWGLSRISNKGRLTLDDRTVYHYNDHSTANVKVFVVDSGINIDHNDFEGRAKDYKNFVAGEGYRDLFGHGTHVAGTIAGKTFGVAKQAQILNVKVLGADGTGTSAAVIAGIEAVTTAAKESPSSRYVLNLSIGGPRSVAEEDALRAAVKAGVHVVAAAGNQDVDACTQSPGSSEKDGVIVVGATTSKDEFATFSNWGKCVSVLAPGVDILSAWITGKNSVQSIEGTSMASPHVAGLVAYWYARDATLTPALMKARILHYARSGKITGIRGDTPNKMIWNGL